MQDEAKEVKKAAGEQLALHEVEREIHLEKLHAQRQHRDALRDLRKEVEEEAEAYKEFLEQK